MPLIALGIAGAVSGIAGGAIAAHGAGKAGDVQAQAANQAALLQKQAADQSLAEQKRQFDTQQSNIKPWLDQGMTALGKLGNMSFTAPTGEQAQQDPGYAFRLQEGQKALERSAAASGNLFSGGTGKALQQYGQDYASGEYSKVYDRAFQEYQQAYNQFAGQAGMGQTALSSLNQSSQNYANNTSSTLLSSANAQGNAYQNAGAARASGYVGAGNAWAGGLSGGVNSVMDAILLSKLGKH